MTKGTQRIRQDTVLVGPDGKPTREGYNLLVELFDQVQDQAALTGFTAAQIADKDAIVNTTDKQIGRQVYDTTNDRVMVADGSDPTDDWTVADGSASVTPA